MKQGQKKSDWFQGMIPVIETLGDSSQTQLQMYSTIFRTSKFILVYFHRLRLLSKSIYQTIPFNKFINFLSFVLALLRLDFDAPTDMPSISAISAWVYPSMAYRLSVSR